MRLLNSSFVILFDKIVHVALSVAGVLTVGYNSRVAGDHNLHFS